MNKLLPTQNTPELQAMRGTLKGRDHGYAHARRLSLQNKFVGSTPFSSPEPLGLILTTWPRNDGLWGREWVNAKFEIAITGTIIENPSFYSDIRRFGRPSCTLVVVINVWLCFLTGYVLKRPKK